MNKGIYIALSGSIQKQNQINTVTHNVANATTLGFKKDRISFHEHLISRISGMPESDDGKSMTDLTEVRTDYSQGSLFATGNPLDIALNGKGFFEFEGNVFGRKGNFQIDRAGYIVASNGRRVQGAAGPIQIPPGGGRIDVGPDGQVAVDGVPIGTIRVVDFRNPDSLVALSDGEYRSPEAPIASTASLSSGYLEASNVNAVREMIEMITTLREFEIYQKAIRVFDDATARVLELAKG